MYIPVSIKKKKKNKPFKHDEVHAKRFICTLAILS